MRLSLGLLVCWLTAGLMLGQVGPVPGSVSFKSGAQQSAQVPAGNNSTLLNVTVDAPPTGQDSIDVLVGDPNVVISLIAPGGTEITSANASGNGFTFTTYTTDGSGDSADLLSPFLTGGTHTVIQFPVPAQTGLYSVKANAAAAQTDTAMLVFYYPSSSVSLGVITDSGTYRQGDLAILSGLVFDGQTPIQNATLTAVAGTFLPVNGTIGNYQLVNTQQLDSTFSRYTYTVQLANSGAAANNIAATVSSVDPAMSIDNDAVAFGTVSAGASVSGGNTFSFIYPTASSYSLSDLQWVIQSPSTPINLTLADSGTYDAAAGDGIYTGTFTPTDPGDYILLVTASGTSTSGSSFVRTASTTFHVIVSAAQFASVSDAPINDPVTGQITGVNVTATANVTAAGQYQLSLNLLASNGHSIQARSSAQLTAGSGQIVVYFPASQLLTLGVDGPYTISQAQLTLITATDSTLVDYEDPAGTTQAYLLSSMSRGLVYFTGTNSATGIVTGSGISAGVKIDQ